MRSRVCCSLSLSRARAVFYVDSILHLFRLYSILQFAHYVLQIAICSISNSLKASVVRSGIRVPSQCHRRL